MQSTMTYSRHLDEAENLKKSTNKRNKRSAPLMARKTTRGIQHGREPQPPEDNAGMHEDMLTKKYRSDELPYRFRMLLGLPNCLE